MTYIMTITVLMADLGTSLQDLPGFSHCTLDDVKPYMGINVFFRQLPPADIEVGPFHRGVHVNLVVDSKAQPSGSLKRRQA